MTTYYQVNVEIGIKFVDCGAVMKLLNVDDYEDLELMLKRRLPKGIKLYQSCGLSGESLELVIYAPTKKLEDAGGEYTTEIGPSIPFDQIDEAQLRMEQCIHVLNELGIKDVPPIGAVLRWMVG